MQMNWIAQIAALKIIKHIFLTFLTLSYIYRGKICHLLVYNCGDFELSKKKIELQYFEIRMGRGKHL